jgi:NADH:ubiquinone oxidoreductase subunit D
VGETWISESVEHPKTYLPAQQAKMAESGVQLQTVQMKVQKPFYNDMKENCIPQRGASAANQNGVIKNVVNNERLANHPQGKVNVGIKNANLGEFNKNIVSAKKIDPSSWRYKNGVTKAVSRYGAETTGLVVCELAENNAAADNDDDYE